MRHSFAAFAVTSIVAAFVASPGAQQPSRPTPQPPPIRTAANFVRVDVFPTRDGRPVQDLALEDFELLEDGEPQKIEAFEHVVIRPAGPQDARVEPQSVRDAERMAANPRSRVFVIFLDVPHVSIASGHHIKEPIITLLDRIIGPEDLVAVMTPGMSPTQITLGRKTEIIERGLRENWPWGRRDSILPFDEHEEAYRVCYAPLAGEGHTSKLALQMIERRRERIALEALDDLVKYLGGLRDERKAILTVTEGWQLYRPDHSIEAIRKDPISGRPADPIPGVDPIGVGPDGKLTRDDPRNRSGDTLSQYQCDTERLELAAMDNDRFFRDLMHAANRANASFYPIDPRGLAAFDDSIGPKQPLPPAVSQRVLQNKIELLRTLAVNTDGLAVVNTNDLKGAMHRIAADLTSYYLLGYYSTNTKLDGRFRSIKVRVKQPGVEVRARRGYLAATAAEVSAAAAAAAAPAPSNAAPVSSALGTLARIRPDARFRVHAVPARDPETGRLTGVWVAGEVPPGLPEWAQGGRAAIEISGQGVTASGQATMKPGERAFLTLVPAQGPSGALDVRARLASSAPAVLPLMDAVHVETPEGLGDPLMFRRGPSTANRQQPAADFRFSRTERLRLEVALAPGVTPGAGRVLDRNAKPIELPVAVAERTDAATGQRWLTADLVLAPLGPGDYVIELAAVAPSGEQRVVTAVRVTR